MVPGSQQRAKLLKGLLWNIYQLNKITEEGKEQVTVKLKRVYDEAATNDGSVFWWTEYGHEVYRKKKQMYMNG